jgi:hypothetical protein
MRRILAPRGGDGRSRGMLVRVVMVGRTAAGRLPQEEDGNGV